ncbi:TPA: hypothetical protein DEP34_05240 [Candidatus Uhrbacteria bacterium]|uniref:Thioredoxin domain-containing protein n=2 Tax=Candidatus Uhriibacteriota TaxID=1752732 RepID=A0A0G1SEF8_9BACT|nr:MAG: hypothetical protein UX45_C0017G0011 [Candidatus Uhrbacteria bacterium GW2011_GWF2_46_218]KKU40478.1 MAG: hypothetical protein UX57_C0016G0011 [Candidatus Uhrbacteria bacterium GW2011_GWE2_46_68]HBK34008.1 hypothetical protein [Candidatus Uhrbacteria bacterium]HCB19743.1 hypothetical protein [Candidatus Uhrbacteria bacterium]
MRNLFLFCVGIFIAISLFPLTVRAEDVTTELSPLNVYFFYGDGCPHCSNEEPFLKAVEEQYSFVNVYAFEVWYDEVNQSFLRQAGEVLGANAGSVPFTVIGDQFVSGYATEKTTGAQILRLIAQCAARDCEDPLSAFIDVSGMTTLGGETSGQEEVTLPITANPSSKEDQGVEITLPLFGTISSSSFSLPVLTILIGALDGFNPCAMWTLLFLISLLVNMHNKKRMWMLGSAFVFASGFVYFLFLSAWLNVFLFIGMMVWVRIVIGAVALASGGYNLREYMRNKDGTCKVTSHENRKKVFDRLRAVAHHQQFWMALIGIVLLAFAVNLVELVCSAGLPAIYTQVLSLNDLPAWQYYGYLLLYIFFFMLDDLIVFIVSMATLHVTGITSKYSRYSHLIGGILMLVLGALLILRPELLMFG